MFFVLCVALWLLAKARGGGGGGAFLIFCPFFVLVLCLLDPI